MKSNRSRLLFLLASLSALVLLTALKGPILAPGRDPVMKPLAIFTEVLNITRSNYVEPVDVSTLLAGAYDGVTDAIDPYSYYIPAGSMPRYRSFEAAHALDGGLVLGRRGGFAYVVAPVPGSPAEAAGIKSGDVILEVEGVSARNESLWETQSRLSGPEGSSVSLKVLRGGDEREVTVRISRRKFEPSKVSERTEGGIPVVRIPFFQPGASASLRQAIEALRDRSGTLIVDVRDSAGGDPEEAVRAASLFVEPGLVTKLTGKKIPVKEFSSSASPVWKGRTIVLVDGGSGGAPEIFAGALLDRNHSELVGESTAGMGIVQRLLPMSSGGALYMTVGQYVTPSGTELTGRGLKPTTRVDLFPGDGPAGTDAVMKKALEIAHAAPAKAAA